MKKTRYFLFALLLVCSVSLGWHSQKAEAKVHDTTIFKCTDTSITVSWQDPYETVANFDPEYYELLGYSIYDYDTDSYLKENISAKATSCKIKDLKKGYTGYWRIYFSYRLIGDSEIKSYCYDGLYVNTTPKKVSKSNLGIGFIASSENECQFVVKKDTGMTGFQLQVYKGSDKVKTFKITTSYTDYFKYKKKTVYKYRARQFYTNPDTKKTYYGDWSSYRYFTAGSDSLKTSSDSKGTKVTIKKISGVKNFVIYVSKKRDSGFKKTATVTVKDKSKTIRIKKIGDKNLKAKEYYYIKIVPMIKVGDDTVKSDLVSIVGFYNYK